MFRKADKGLTAGFGGLRRDFLGGPTFRTGGMADGTEAMIGRFTQWRPRPGVDRREALLAWDRHARLVERVPGLRRYVQNRIIATPPEGNEPSYAGLGEAWFDDLAAAQAALQSSEWAAVIEDAKTFMDFDSLIATWVERRTVREL